ncbi:predicted protein [Streptomyces iranensis]|uniref:Uncharacterized protein n=1 Tax=Streptomyces iranensis TaxID=576784 RepID=A0A060ZMT0_9ACTN|nr:predicted protein [Streptomyces iranensis]
MPQAVSSRPVGSSAVLYERTMVSVAVSRVSVEPTS